MADPTTESIENATATSDEEAPRAPTKVDIHILIEGPRNRVLWISGAKSGTSEHHDPRSGARIVVERREFDMLGSPYWAFAGRFDDGDDVYLAITQLASVRSQEREAMHNIARGAVERARLLVQGLYDLVTPAILDDPKFKAWSESVTVMFRAFGILMTGGTPVARMSPEGLARTLAHGVREERYVTSTWALATTEEG